MRRIEKAATTRGTAAAAAHPAIAVVLGSGHLVASVKRRPSVLQKAKEPENSRREHEIKALHFFTLPII
jgi:hypothetical protein